MRYVPSRRDWSLPARAATPESAALGRREFLRCLGLAGAGIAATGAVARAVGAAQAAGALASAAVSDTEAGRYRRDPRFALDRPLTDELRAGSSNNFYEFTEHKQRVSDEAVAFATHPWRLRIDGLVRRPSEIDRDDLERRMPRAERLYRHRCVEGWSMAVPWRGFPLASLIRWASPLSSARYLRVVSFHRPAQAPNQARATWYPWPYVEALRLDEAMNELAFVATGIYGHELPRSQGAPIRLVLPWKYGLKSAKSIVRFQFTAERPRTFWSSLAPDEYGFLSNVNPSVPHPRWSQATERPIGTGETRPTLPYNGYGPCVARLYDRASETFRS